MKKIIVLLSLLITTQAFAITTKNSGKPEGNNSAAVAEIPKWMKSKNGRVVVFDKTLHTAIINQKSYIINSNTHVYDGEPVKGSRVRFNTNEQNVITDLWIHKK